MKKISVKIKWLLLTVLVAMIVFGWSVWGLIHPCTLIDNEFMYAAREGHILTVCDRVGDETYQFRITRERRSEVATEPETLLKTETMKVEALPHSGLRLTTLGAGEVYEITVKRGWK